MNKNNFEILSKEVDELIKSIEKSTKRLYTSAYRETRNRLNSIYLKYADLEGVNILDLMKKSEVRKLDREVAKELVDMYRSNENKINGMLGDIADKAFENTLNSIEKYNLADVKREIDFTNVINREIAGHVWTDRLDKRSRDFIFDVHGIIHKGLADGDTFTTMARNLKKKFGNDIGNTMRIARTEGARVLEDAKYESFKGVSENDNMRVYKIWRTMGDEAVRSSHAAMEGQKVLYDEPFTLPSGVTAMYPKASGDPGEDINCRCYVEYVTEVVDDIKTIANKENVDNANIGNENVKTITENGYNINEPIETQSDEAIRAWIYNHEKKLNHEKYEEHNINSKRYDGKKSYYNLTENEVQEIINKNAGKGEILRTNGLWTRKEFIVENEMSGIYKNLEGGEWETNQFIIIYKNNGYCHLIPSNPKRK